MYNILRKILFCLPPEEAHHFSMNGLSIAGKIPGTKRLFAHRSAFDPRLRREVFGLSFRNPVGLGAGFDKNALYLDELDMLGFGSVEIGTVTPKSQAGNEKPRLFRIPAHQAIINRMGFNNQGVKAVAERLRAWQNKRHRGATPDHPAMIIGGNIGKNKSTPNEEAWKDYELCFRELRDCVDYFTVNVSSPNTPGLRELQSRDSLNRILSHLQTINRQQGQPRPILLKIAPDLDPSQLDEIISLAIDLALDGIVATNTTVSREGLTGITPEQLEKVGSGGLSGAPLRQRSTEVVRYISERTEGRIPIIASGGIFTAADAIAKLKAGASLVQVWTGFIYEGPSIVKNICTGLLDTIHTS